MHLPADIQTKLLVSGIRILFSDRDLDIAGSIRLLSIIIPGSTEFLRRCDHIGFDLDLLGFMIMPPIEETNHRNHSSRSNLSFRIVLSLRRARYASSAISSYNPYERRSRGLKHSSSSACSNAYLAIRTAFFRALIICEYRKSVICRIIDLDKATYAAIQQTMCCAFFHQFDYELVLGQLLQLLPFARRSLTSFQIDGIGTACGC